MRSFRSKFSKGALVFALTGAVAAAAAAGSTEIPLTCSLCQNMLTEVVLHVRHATLGVPPYISSMMAENNTQAPAVYMLTDGQQFSVVNEAGQTDTVTIHASDFADVTMATQDEVVNALAPQLTVAQPLIHEGRLFLRGPSGGELKSLQVHNVTGTPLDALGFTADDMMFGANEVGMAVVVPKDAGPTPTAFAGLPYIVLASTTEGVTPLAPGVDLPIVLDAATLTMLNATIQGTTPSLAGALDGDQHAQAGFPATAVTTLFAGAVPKKLYFAFVVLSSDLSQFVYASNRFTVTTAP